MIDKTLFYYESNACNLSKRYESANVNNIHILLLNTFSINSRLLEIGSGSGRDASFMFHHGYNIHAIDGSKEMITEAKKHHPELIDKLEVLKIPDELCFEPSSFGGIYSIAALMHLNKNAIDNTFKKIAVILQPRGKFLFSVSLQRGDVNNQGFDEKGRYFTTMCESEWIRYSEKHGLRLEYSEISSDGLNRDEVSWLTCIVGKEK